MSTDTWSLHIPGGPREGETEGEWVARRVREGCARVGDLFAGDPPELRARRELNRANTAPNLVRHVNGRCRMASGHLFPNCAL